MKSRIATIAELQQIRCCENGELLVSLTDECPDIICEYRRKDSDQNKVLVRKSVCKRLQKVQSKLCAYDSQLRLLVVEGYRSPVYQESYYLKELLTQYKEEPDLDFEALLERVHQLVALPSVAGHPTGGAIDLSIVRGEDELDMGGRIADFSIPAMLPTHSPFITPEQAKWRFQLHDLMVDEGFAPFYGEWWHFSYGDREWAAFYGMQEAFYTSILLC